MQPVGLLVSPLQLPLSAYSTFPGRKKYVFFRQNSSRLMMWSTVMLVLFFRSWSSSSCFLMMSMAGSIGIDVKSALTSRTSCTHLVAALYLWYFQGSPCCSWHGGGIFLPGAWWCLPTFLLFHRWQIPYLILWVLGVPQVYILWGVP